MKAIGIIGSRRRNSRGDFLAVEKCFLSLFQEGDIIVSGGCPKGGDRFAEILAKRYRAPISVYRPDWKLGKHAGFLRNSNIAKASHVLIACVASDRRGGTEDTIKKFNKLGKGTNLFVV